MKRPTVFSCHQANRFSDDNEQQQRQEDKGRLSPFSLSLSSSSAAAAAECKRDRNDQHANCNFKHHNHHHRQNCSFKQRPLQSSYTSSSSLPSPSLRLIRYGVVVVALLLLSSSMETRTTTVTAFIIVTPPLLPLALWQNVARGSKTIQQQVRRRRNQQNNLFLETVLFASQSSNDVSNSTFTSSSSSSAAASSPSSNNAPIYFAPGPSVDTKPDYDNIVGPLGRWMDTLFLTVFRRALETNAGLPSKRPLTDYQGIIEVTHAMNQRFSQAVVQQRALEVLIALFPSWMPPAYTRLFSRPFPRFSARMNAWATRVAGTWLMGNCTINDVVVMETTTMDTNGQQKEQEVTLPNQGLLVERCRFLEESGCASVCVNSCKLPTQTFFLEKMGLPLTMEPNYETFECQFSFGKLPTPETELAAKLTPCLMRCPTAGSLRTKHNSMIMNNYNKSNNDKKSVESGPAALPAAVTVEAAVIQGNNVQQSASQPPPVPSCQLMDGRNDPKESY